MLVSRITYAEKDDKLAAAFQADMGAVHNVPWPLPNMKPSSEKEFWAEASYHGFKASAYGGQRSLDGDWATVMAYYVDAHEMLKSGFVVAVFKRLGHERVEYYRWSACDHSWKERQKGNCWHEYRCEKCGSIFDIDSSG